jgi:hypothetical protein
MNTKLTVDQGEAAIQLKAALASKDANEVEIALSGAWNAGLQPEMCADLTNLAEASWHTRHEDIVQSIQRLRCPEAVPALERTAHALYEYLNYDEFFGLARKCTWALADIGTREAYAALERLAKSSNSQIARHAKKRLEHWRDELVRKPNDAATLWRPVGPKELRLICKSMDLIGHS